MMHKFCIEALDIILLDLMKNPNVFGNKTILMSGDWRQTSPIVPFATPADIVDAAFISSSLWKSITRMRLTISQRDKNDAPYSAFGKNVGENNIPTQRFPDHSELIPLSNSSDAETSDHFTMQYTTDFTTLLNFVYPDINADPRTLHDHAILATLNDSIDECNKHIISSRSKPTTTFYSSNSIISVVRISNV